MKAVKFGLATFIMPCMFRMSAALLGQGSAAEVAQALVTATLGVWLLASATEGWMLRGPLPLPLRFVAGATAIMLLVPEALTDIAGLVIATALIAWQYRAHAAPARA
jgi:TRAP-type uncharacterized transport system fused permease subunit